jgi:DNA-binding NarL/FixJ family response regulator
MTMELLTPTHPAAPHAESPAPLRERISLVLADAHPIVLEGMWHLFRKERDLDTLACCSREEETLAALERHRPAILVLDLHLPARGGLAVLRNLPTTNCPKVVLAAGSIAKDAIADALHLGVRGVVLKEMAPDLIVKCIRQVHQGAMWLEHASAFAAVNRMLRQESDLERLKHSLTRRELEVLQLVAGGLRNRDITGRLKISEGTVKIHLHHIYEKLGARDRVDLVLRAREGGLA